jgi:negative regulator of sigma E activity
MTAKIPDDLLSAFLDREVTPDEEAAARKQLKSSPQARQEFQAYQRLGELLHELPRRTAPTEFAAAVMQQAERETLIPLEAAGASPANSQSFRPSRRAWIVSLVGLAATAATVLVVVNASARKDAFAVRDATFGPRSLPQAQVAKSVALDVSPAPAASKRAADSNLAVAQADRQLPAMARPAAPPPNVAAMAPRAVDAEKSRMVFPAELKSAQEGDVVEALESVGDQVAVVRLTLVNRTASFGGLQNLLVRDASRPVRGAEKAKLMKERFAEAKGSVVVDAKTVSNGPGELICVFVEGSRDELVGVLKDVQNQSQVQRAQLTNAISAEKLAEYAQRPVATAGQEGEHGSARAQALSLPHAMVDKILAGASTVSHGAAGGSRGGSPGGALASRGAARQGQAFVAADAGKSTAVSKPAMIDGAAQQAGMPAQQSVAAKDQPGALKGKQLIAGTTQRSYQVFFVLDDQSVTESQDKAAAAADQVSPESKSHVRPRTPVRARRPARKRVVKPN